MKKINLFNIKAFTLAEVLITLLIIGVVASLTIPNLINDIQDQQYKVAYKKAYAVATQAWHTVVFNQENESIVSGYQGSNIYNNFVKFKNNFSVTKECMGGTGNFNCWIDGERFFTLPTNSASSFVDSSGMIWTTACSTCSSFEFYLDTNGRKPPNKWGKDKFPLYPQLNGTISLPPDYPNTNPDWCPSGGCYYKSWLYN